DVNVLPSFDISDYLVGGKLPTEDTFGDLSTYSEAQNAIINAYKVANNVEQAYYIFVTDKASSTGQSGYMKLNGQFGFVFDQNALTIAHELAHGAFKLEHPFKKFKNKGVSERTTQSLMDYPPVANFLFTDWKQINDPAFKLYAFQGQSDGEHNPLGHLGITPNGKIFDQFFLNNHRISITYLISKNYTINSIKYNDRIYEWNTSKDAFVNGEVTITTKKIKVAIDNKVNVYQSRNNDKCIYDYALIEWTSENEKALNISELIENKLESSSFTGWLPSPYDVRDASCSNNFSQEILSKDRQPCSLENVTQGLAILETALTKTDGEKVAELVNQVCLSALRGLDHNKKENLIIKIASQDRLIESSELAILRLMTAIDSKNYHTFFKLLEQNNNQLLKHLIAEIDDVSVYFWKDKENYTNFMGALVTMFNQNPESIANRWPSDDDSFASRVINLEPIIYKDESSTLLLIESSKYNNGEYDSNTGQISLYDIYKISSVSMGTYVSVKNEEFITEVSPLTPLIIIPNKGKLPLIETALGENSLDGNAYIVPAVFLKYTNDKIRNDYIEKAVITTLDVATIAASGGTALATKVHWVRRAWAIAEVAGAVSNITVNTVQVSPEAKEIVDNFNLAMGVIGLKNVAVGGYKFAVKLPETTKNLLKQNKSLRDLLLSQYLDYRIAITKLKNSDDWSNLSTEIRQNIAKQEKAFIDITDAKNIPNDKWGVPKDAFINGKTSEDILTIPNGSRPLPETYLSSSYINEHLKTFEEGGAYLVPKKALDDYGRDLIGRPDNSQFIMSKSEMDNLLLKANGNLTHIETELGIPPGLWKDKELVRIDIPNPKNLKLRMPSGNEGGANDLWLPGGLLPKGYKEAVINRIPKGEYTETLTNIK
ncbi:hypothetical protein, partial [Paenimyroides tangerinum]|uniref:hypothetical protein n=1 Tax=Paenimyroides tangerinum TaxID=2488728 RepID=UPI0013153386